MEDILENIAMKHSMNLITNLHCKNQRPRGKTKTEQKELLYGEFSRNFKTYTDQQQTT